MAASKEKMADQKEIAPKFLKSISTTPSSGFSFEGGYSSPIEPCSQSSSHGLKLQSQQILQKHKYVVHEYNNCFVCLQEAFAEVNLLRQENLMLRDETIELLKLVTEKEKENEIMSLISGPNITPDFHQIGLNILGDTGRQVLEEQHLPRGDLNAGKRIGREMDSEENNLVNRGGVVPKIISIRSNGFLEMNNQLVNKPSSSRCSATGHETNRPFRLRLAPNNPSQGCEDEEGVELEVYNQGMFKTELCNKWEQTKNCPYGDRCQFAHGIEELRPVIRHPRYKTEICRMISSGGTCPYGHRCHFRHALLPNEEEKEVVL